MLLVLTCLARCTLYHILLMPYHFFYVPGFAIPCPASFSLMCLSPAMPLVCPRSALIGRSPLNTIPIQSSSSLALLLSQFYTTLKNPMNHITMPKDPKQRPRFPYHRGPISSEPHGAAQPMSPKTLPKTPKAFNLNPCGF